jgi:hypothetical protein
VELFEEVLGSQSDRTFRTLPKARYHLHNSRILDPDLNHMDPIYPHELTYVPETDFNITVLSTYTETSKIIPFLQHILLI